MAVHVRTLDGIVTVISVDKSHMVLEVTRAVCSRIGKMYVYKILYRICGGKWQSFSDELTST